MGGEEGGGHIISIAAPEERYKGASFERRAGARASVGQGCVCRAPYRVYIH